MQVTGRAHQYCHNGLFISTTACYKTCYQRHVISRCGCADSAYPMYGAAFDSDDHEPCSSSSESEGQW